MMRQRLILGFAFLLTVTVGFSQSRDEYLKLRRTIGVVSPTAGAAIQNVVGTRSFEVRGVVQGVSAANNLSYILFKTDDEALLTIRTSNLPEWLTANETSVRLLVKANRESDTSELIVFLLGAAPDALVEPFLRAESARATTSKVNPNTTSRASSPLRGAITRGGSFNKGAASRTHQVPTSDVTPVYAQFIKGRNPRLSDAEAYRIAQGIIGFSLKYGVDARLIVAILIIESGFNPNATSRAGAMGLGQLMPATAKGLGITQPYDSIENLYGTVRTIRGHLERYHKQTGDGFEALILSLAAYNAGSGAVRRHGGVPPYAETQAYVRKVSEVYYKLCGQ